MLVVIHALNGLESRLYTLLCCKFCLHNAQGTYVAIPFLPGFAGAYRLARDYNVRACSESLPVPSCLTAGLEAKLTIGAPPDHICCEVLWTKRGTEISNY